MKTLDDMLEHELDGLLGYLGCTVDDLLQPLPYPPGSYTDLERAAIVRARCLVTLKYQPARLVSLILTANL